MSKGNFRRQGYKIYNDLIMIGTATINDKEETIGEVMFRTRIEKIKKDIRYFDYWIVDSRKLK